jgi:chemotaxis protein MotA
MALIGLIFGVFSIFGSFIMEGGKPASLILIPAMIIVFGGTAAAAIIGTPKEILFKFHILFKLALFPPKVDAVGIIRSLVELSTVARKEGILALEDRANSIESPFYRKMILLAVDGIEPEVIRAIAENEIAFISERHMANAGLFQKMGGYSPTMGIIGTVMGLIATLANAGGDPNDLVKHIASAFIATLWGVFMANIVWLPICDRLKAIHSEEKLYLEIIIEGITSIQSGENPTVTGMKLFSMLPGNMQGSARGDDVKKEAS